MPHTQTEPTKTVLVTDDSAFFRSMLSYALEEDGYRVVSAASGEEALALLGTEREVALVLLDLVMPGMNGIEVLKRIRATPAGASLPVLVLTQFALNAVEREILTREGALEVLAKSAPIERILFAVREALHPEERERRRAPRIPVSLPVTVRTPQATHLCSTFNVSDSGMFLVRADGDSPKPGSDLQLKFWVPGEDRLFEAKARVAWVNAGGPEMRRSHPSGFGVEFVSIEPAAKEALAKFMRELV